MKSSDIAVIAIGFATALCIGPTSSDGQDCQMRQGKPLLVLTGAVSQVATPAYHRVSSSDTLKELWRSHLGPMQDRGDSPAPEVDFEHCVVLALFEGSSFNSHGLRIEAVLDAGNETVVRFDDISYQTFGDANAVTPYAFVVLPKSDNVIVLEKNVQQYIGKPPEWKEVARLGTRELR